MRKFVKTAAVLALAFALLSTSALAALDKEASGIVRHDDGTYTATIVGAEENEQISIIAVDSVGDGDTLPAITDNNIFYINQKTATGSSDTFANFTLMGETEGETYHFFAGSSKSSEATYLGEVYVAVNYTVTVEPDVEVEAKKSEDISLTITPAYTGDVVWTVESDNKESATLTNESANGVTFSATVEGEYTVRATIADGTYGEAVVTVLPMDVEITGFTPKIVTVEADGEVVENQNAVGVALTFENLREGFTHMIWGFGDGSGDTEKRKYSTAISIEGISGPCTFAAAFGNGTKSGTADGTNPEKVSFDVKDISALFFDGVDTFFTHPELDQNNRKSN